MIDFSEQYCRQIALPEIGMQGQEKIANSHIVIVGCGGIGCPVALYLAAAGIGRLTLIDSDVVSVSNLHRQILFSRADIGLSKVQVAKSKLSLLYPDVTIQAIDAPLDTCLAQKIVADADIVIDGTDSFFTKYILSPLTRQAGKAFLMGAIVGYQGYVAGFHAQTPCYRDIFEMPSLTAKTCDSAGVVGSHAGYVSMILVTEAIKYLVGLSGIIGKMLSFDLKTMRHHQMNFYVCDTIQKALSLNIDFIAESHLLPRDVLVDVRTKAEQQDNPFSYPVQEILLIPLDAIKENLESLQDVPHLVFACLSSRRAQMAALAYSLLYPEKSVKVVYKQARFINGH